MDNIISGIIGLVAGLLIPLVRWRIDELRDTRNNRKEMIEKWRTTLKTLEVAGNIDNFIKTTAYSSLRPNMRQEVKKQLEAPRMVYAEGVRGNVKKHLISDEISRIEREWKLV